MASVGTPAVHLAVHLAPRLSRYFCHVRGKARLQSRSQLEEPEHSRLLIPAIIDVCAQPSYFFRTDTLLLL